MAEPAEIPRRHAAHRRSWRTRARRAALDWLDVHDTSLIAGLAIAICVGSVLAVGTVHGSVLLLVAPVAIATATLAVWREGWSVKQLPRASLVLLFLSGYTALQALPLPAELLAVIAPKNFDVWARALHGFGEAVPGWVTVSLDPGATRVEALKWFTYAAVLLVGAVVGGRLGARWGASLVFGAAGLAAGVALAHAVLGAEKLYGFYEPVRTGRTLGPLLNPNNLAGYLNLGAFTGVGVLVASRTRGPRWLIAIAVATTMAVSLLTGSRGGAASLIVGVLLLVPMLRATRRLGRHRVEGRVESAVEVMAVVVGAAALFFLGARRQVWNELLQEGAEKLGIVAWTRPMIADHLWLGVGRGAYETVFPAYDLDHSHMLYQYAENFAAQWISEWGLPVGLGALIALAASLTPRRLRALRDPVPAGAIVGVIALLLQNLVDLSMEITGVSIALFLLLGALWGGARRHDERRSTGGPRPRAPGDAAPGALAEHGSGTLARGGAASPPQSSGRRRLPPLLAVAGLAATLGATTGLRPALYERDALLHAYESAVGRDPARHAGFMRELRGAILRHPGDPHLYRMGALASLRDGKNPLRWVAVAIERDRASGRPYLVLAEALLRAKAHQQALASVRTMLEHEAHLLGAALPLVLRMTKEPEQIARAAPAGAQGAEVLTRFAEALNDRSDTERRRRLLALAMERDPNAVKPRLVDAADLLAALGPAPTSLRCEDSARAACLARLEEHARVLQEVAPHEPHAAMLRARSLMVQQRPRAAEQLLAGDCKVLGSPLDCLRLRVHAAESAGDARVFTRAVSDHLEAACADAHRCAAAHAFVGQLYLRRKEWRAAAEHFERAAFESNDPNAWLKVATAAARAGELARSKRAFDRARAAGVRPASRELDEARGELLRRALERARAEER